MQAVRHLQDSDAEAKGRGRSTKRGLSTFEDPLRAPINIDKAAIIETDMLKTLEAVRNGAGANDTHVSIRPPNDENRAKLLAWVEAGQESELILEVQRAVERYMEKTRGEGTGEGEK